MFFRLAGWLAVAVFSSLLVVVFAPQQMPVTLYKFSLIAVAGVAGYWLDRSLFPESRTSLFLHAWQEDANRKAVIAPLLAAAMIRKALIVSAAMIAVALGA